MVMLILALQHLLGFASLLLPRQRPARPLIQGLLTVKLLLISAKDLTSPGTLVESMILMKEFLVRMMDLASPAGCLLLWKLRGS